MLRALIIFLTVAACSAADPDIVRPCNLNHHKCLTENLAVNSKCNPNVRGYIPSEYIIDRFPFHAAAFNATYVDNNLKIRNHDRCFVSDFFYSKSTKTFVLTIDCPLLEFESDRLVIHHYTAQLDKKYSYDFGGRYPLVRVTANLPTSELDLCNILAFADVTALPIFFIVPKDQKTANYLSRDLTLLNIYERETFFYRANQLIRLFVNSYICDFGCDL